jgi:hypothetical protein
MGTFRNPSAEGDLDDSRIEFQEVTTSNDWLESKSALHRTVCCREPFGAPFDRGITTRCITL